MEVTQEDMDRLSAAFIKHFYHAYCDDKPTQVTTLSGTPQPARFPFRVENIEDAQIEPA